MIAEEDENARKRIRETEQEQNEIKKNRGNYRCGRCNVPKKGYDCPFYYSIL